MNHAPILLLSLMTLAPVANALVGAATLTEGETTLDASPTNAAIEAQTAATNVRLDARPIDDATTAPAPAHVASGSRRYDFAFGDAASITLLPTGRADTRSNEWAAVRLRASHAIAAPLAPPVSLGVSGTAGAAALARADSTNTDRTMDLGPRHVFLDPSGQVEPPVAEVAHPTATHRASRAPPAAHDSSTQGGAHAVVPLTTMAALMPAAVDLTAAGFAMIAFLAPWVLYHRARGHRVLDQSSRQRIFAALQARPGLSPADAARELELDPTTVRYHLRRLVKEGLVVEEGRRRAIRYFPRGSVAPAERAAHVAAQQARPVLEAVKNNPGASKSDIARSVGLARPTTAWHLDRLARAGLVQFRRQGRTVLVEPTRQA